MTQKEQKKAAKRTGKGIMTPRKDRGYVSNGYRNRAAENVNDAEMAISQFINSNAKNMSTEMVLKLVNTRVLLINALRFLERDGAKTIPEDEG